MKVLLISADSLPASPIGPAYVAGTAQRAGHQVETFECLFTQDLSSELRTQIERFQPEVIGLSIRLVHGYALMKRRIIIRVFLTCAPRSGRWSRSFAGINRPDCPGRSRVQRLCPRLAGVSESGLRHPRRGRFFLPALSGTAGKGGRSRRCAGLRGSQEWANPRNPARPGC
jgi:hypothetical protein